MDDNFNPFAVDTAIADEEEESSEELQKMCKDYIAMKDPRNTHTSEARAQIPPTSDMKGGMNGSSASGYKNPSNLRCTKFADLMPKGGDCNVPNRSPGTSGRSSITTTSSYNTGYNTGAYPHLGGRNLGGRVPQGGYNGGYDNMLGYDNSGYDWGNVHGHELARGGYNRHPRDRNPKGNPKGKRGGKGNRTVYHRSSGEDGVSRRGGP